jgi:hypothetical protein
MQNRRASVSAVIAGLDPAIHPIRKIFDAKKMDRGSSPQVTLRGGQVLD